MGGGGSRKPLERDLLQGKRRGNRLKGKEFGKDISPVSVQGRGRA